MINSFMRDIMANFEEEDFMEKLGFLSYFMKINVLHDEVL